MPLLIDQGRPIAETSIIIEYLQMHHARSGHRLLHADPDAALDVRLWDRMSDLYLMTPMNVVTVDLLRPEDQRDPFGVTQGRQNLLSAYAYFDRRLDERTWVCGDDFSMADCAAAPALFYALAYVPAPSDHAHLSAYFERLVSHPPVAKTIDQARPWLKFFLGREGLARRFFEPGAD